MSSHETNHNGGEGLLGNQALGLLGGTPEEQARRLRVAVAADLVGRSGLDLAAAAAATGVDTEEVAATLVAHASAATALATRYPEGFRLSVIVPAYNEKKTILEILRRVLAVPVPKEVVIVDDGSTDGTRELLQAEVDGKIPGVRVLYHERNQGKGAAIRTALAHVTGEVTVIQDADLEYSPEEYPRLLEPILSGDADVVYGSRFLGGPHRVLFFWHAVGNRWLTTLSNMFTNLNLTDMETCHKVFRTSLLKQIRLRSNRFGIEPELTAKVARLGARVYEMPISYHGRTYREGKKIRWTDGVQALWCILRYRFFD